MEMKKTAWLSLIPLTAFWLCEVHIYTPPAGPAMLLLLIGISLLMVAFWKTDVEFDRRFAIAAIPLVVSCFLIPYPYSIGLIVMAIALITLLILPKGLGTGILFSGVVLTGQSLIISIYYLAAPSSHNVGWLSPIIALLAKITGLEATSANGVVFVRGLENTFPFTVTLEKLGFYPWILIFMGAFVLILLTSREAKAALKRTVSFLIISFVYAIVRYVVLLHVFFATDLPMYAAERMSIFVDPLWLLVSFVPLFLLLGLYPVEASKFDFKSERNRFRLKRIATSIAIFVSVFCLVGAFLFQDPGLQKDGRILVDEIHSVWEFSTLKLDKEWYGSNSTYNAYSMIEWLGDTYDVDRVVSRSYLDWEVTGAAKVAPEIVSDEITPEMLRNYDILIVKTPSPYKPEEVEAIAQFVEGGGGVFLIGDHTNFAGSGTNINEVAEKFGIRFGFDSTNTIDGRLYYYERGAIAHPCIKYMPYFDFMTGCSMTAPIDAEPVILGCGLESVPGEYASTGFFRETRRRDPTTVTDTSWGLFHQALALKHGKGRVVAFCDSTTISNFRMFFGGTPNLIAGCIEYLNHSNHCGYERTLLLAAGLALAGLAGYLLLGEKKMAVLILAIGLGAMSAGFAIASFSTETEDSVPARFYVKDHTICFDSEHSSQIVSRGDKTGDYETFFIWTQRAGLTPSIEDDLEETMEKGKAIVIIDPIKTISPDERLALSKYVENGNSILLMVDEKGEGSELIKSFGMDTYTIPEPANKIGQKRSAEQNLPIDPWGLAIKGGESLLTIGNRTVLAEATYGNGRFILFTESSVFKDGFDGQPGYMGYNSSDPAAVKDLGYDLRALYDLEYQILFALRFG